MRAYELQISALEREWDMRFTYIFTFIALIQLEAAWAQTPPQTSGTGTERARIGSSADFAAVSSEWESQADVTAEQVHERDQAEPRSGYAGVGIGTTDAHFRGYQLELRGGVSGPLIAPGGTDRIDATVGVGEPELRVRVLAESDRLGLDYAIVGSEDSDGRVRVVLQPIALRTLLTASVGAPSQQYTALEPRAGVTGEFEVPIFGAAELRGRAALALAGALGGASDGDGLAGILGLAARGEAGIELEFGADQWRVFADVLYQALLLNIDTIAHSSQFGVNVGVDIPLPANLLPGDDPTYLRVSYNHREERTDVRSEAVESDSGSANFSGVAASLTAEF